MNKKSTILSMSNRSILANFVFAIFLALISALFCGNILFSAEPSAFESQSGTTKKEVKELKKSTQATRDIITDFQSQVKDLSQSLDGLKTLYEGMGVTVRNDSLTLKSQVEKLKSFENTMQSYYNTQVAQKDLIDSLKSQIDTNAKNIAKLDSKLDKMQEVFKTTNDELLKQINLIATQVQTLQDSLKSQIETAGKNASLDVAQKENIANNAKNKAQDSKNDNSSKEDLSKKSPKDILKQAQDSYKQNDFDKSEEYFQYLSTIKQYSAIANFYLGEIKYTKKDYNSALSYFKISISHDDNASYMPILLWHTAWSFKYMHDDDNYLKFLKSLIELYPKSEQAKKAKELVNKKGAKHDRKK